MWKCAWCEREDPSRGEGFTTHGICESCANEQLAKSPIPLKRYLEGLDQPVLAVDGDAIATACNRAALDLLPGSEPPEGKRGGDVFNCVHARNPEGCGRTIHCSACTIRQAVTRTHLTGEPEVLVPATLKAGDPDHPSAVAMTITTVKRGELVLLMIHDVER